jgi:hypothetical protein
MRFYRPILYKAYFDKGLDVTSYIKYIIAFFGLASQDLKTTMWIAGIYAVFCFFLGYAWYKFEIVNCELEVANRFNPFVKEMRKTYQNRKV